MEIEFMLIFCLADRIIHFSLLIETRNLGNVLSLAETNLDFQAKNDTISGSRFLEDFLSLDRKIIIMSIRGIIKKLAGRTPEKRRNSINCRFCYSDRGIERPQSSRFCKCLKLKRKDDRKDDLSEEFAKHEAASFVIHVMESGLEIAIFMKST
ncbi:unnamed protein product [Caenorhabditis angaria]|uniref:Uncharacterized protein n=1 Tax=Caenorhabditis angaria TaxID=860376 RepID=A0A9P1N9N1_9PELO|nr:unnamed protein product [Caenorhabditis angaria]